MENHKLTQHLLAENIAYENPYDFSKIHRHSYFEILLFEKGEGKGTNSIDFVDYPITQNSLHIVAPNQVHLMKRNANDDGILIQFTKEYLLTNSSAFDAEWLFSLQSNPNTQLSPDQFNQLYPLFIQLKNIEKGKSDFQAHILKHYFFHLIFHLLEILNSKSTNKISSDSIRFLGLAESQIKENRTVSYYAQQMNLSIKKLNTEIKKSFGKTPLQMIHDLLAIEIKRLILVDNLSQKEIAYQLNFDSPASYTRFVRKYFSCNPTELKANSKR